MSILDTYQFRRAEISLERGLPCAPDAERMILGVVILDNSVLDQAVERLTPESFFFPSNRHIFTAMLALEGQGSAIDPLTLQNYLQGKELLAQVGGPVYIAGLCEGCPRYSNIQDYVAIVEDCAIRRQQIAAGNLAIQCAFDFEESAQHQLNRAQKLLCDIQTANGQARWFTSGESAYEALSVFEQRMIDGRMITGVATGFTEFDYMTGGLQPSDLYIIGGRPKMGKTAFVGSLMTNAAASPTNLSPTGEKPVIAFFSLEMSRQAITQRMLCSLAQVDMMRARSGMINQVELRRLNDAADQLDAMAIEIDDRPETTPTMMRAKLRQLQQRRGKVDLVIVDYLQMIQADVRGETIREVSENTRALKAIAKDFQVPVLALASLSRKPEDRADKRPVPSDLRESGNIESDADLIAFIYRDAVYNANAEPTLAELLVRMQRNGPTGTVELLFRGGISRFDNLGGNYA